MNAQISSPKFTVIQGIRHIFVTPISRRKPGCWGHQVVKTFPGVKPFRHNT